MASEERAMNMQYRFALVESSDRSVRSNLPVQATEQAPQTVIASEPPAEDTPEVAKPTQ